MNFRFKKKYFIIFVLVIFSTCFLLSNDNDIITPIVTRHARNYAGNQKHSEHEQRIRWEKISTNFSQFNRGQEVIEPLDYPIANDFDQISATRRDFIVNMMKFAWESYKKFSWSYNELRPIRKTSHTSSIFGSGRTGATIIDGIDTLYIMGLQKEYEEAYKWIKDEFSMKKVVGEISVFETNIRFIGGLLSSYALTNDRMFLLKARDVADLLLPAFNTLTGIPYSFLNVNTGEAHNAIWASGCSILSEFGSLQLEFNYLSWILSNSTYSDKIVRIYKTLQSIEKPGGLYPNYMHPSTGKWGQRHVSVGALGDSFYEYLLKSWLVSGKQELLYKELYDSAMKAVKEKLLKHSQQNNLTYFIELKGNRFEHKMDHLACFLAGLFALEALNEKEYGKRQSLIVLAEEIGKTCHEAYIRTETGIGPETFRFTSEVEAKAVADREKYYILRPEVIEGWFYLWRLTHKQKYREWCWQAANAIEKYCRTSGGYSGIRNVYRKDVDYDDVQQSFILAETFKYLYLTFSSDGTIPLDKWIFNTEAHPFPVYHRQ